MIDQYNSFVAKQVNKTVKKINLKDFKLNKIFFAHKKLTT